MNAAESAPGGSLIDQVGTLGFILVLTGGLLELFPIPSVTGGIVALVGLAGLLIEAVAKLPRWMRQIRLWGIGLALIVLGFAGLGPPSFGFLATNGSSGTFTSMLNYNYLSWRGWVEQAFICGVLGLLVGLPGGLRVLAGKTRALPGEQPPLPGEEDLPNVLASITAVLTAAYVLQLHIGGPLRKIPAEPLTAGTVALAALLLPLYRSVATACLREPFSKIFNPRRLVGPLGTLGAACVWAWQRLDALDRQSAAAEAASADGHAESAET